MMADGASPASALTRRPEAAPAPSPRAPRSRGPRCTARRPSRAVRWPGYRQSDSRPLGPPTLEGTLELEISAGNGRVVPWAGRIARMAPVADVPEICGSCDERFSGVRSALAANFRDHGEVGAAVAITLEGRLVVGPLAGRADRARPRPWQRDTPVDGFSVRQAIAALSLPLLA